MFHRFKLLSAFLFFTSLLSPLVSNAAQTVLVNAPDPYPQSVMGDSSLSIYYAGNMAGTPTIAHSIDLLKGYRFIDTDSVTGTGLIYLDVSTSKTLTVGANQALAVTLKAQGGNEIVLTGASSAVGTAEPSTCAVSGLCLNDAKGALYSAGTTLRLSFTVTNLCNAGGSGTLCTGGVVQDSAGTTRFQNIEVNFGVVNTVPAPTGPDVSAATTNDQVSITFGITDVNPTTSCGIDLSQYYFPGDGQIYLYASNIVAGTNGGPALQYLLTMAKKDSLTAVDYETYLAGGGTNTIIHYTPASTSLEEIAGFINTTDGQDNKYALVIQAQNKAGLVSATTSKCDLYPIQSQDISGILKESKCFIATAAYQDGRAAPVMMLRKFRDQILSQFSAGREFIKTYYEYSPALAEWAWNKPIVRAFALKLLAPIELMAWTILKIASAEEITATESVQPYIDRLKKSLITETEPSGVSGSYSEQERKKLEQSEGQRLSPDSKQPYIERLQKKLAKEESEPSAEGYSQKEKSKLPAVQERESPIITVKEGRDRKLDFGEMPDINNAAGFKLGVSPGMQVVVADSTHSFSDVYGTSWQPELIFHYERQFFHSENFGSLGVGTDFGLAYSGGKGLLQFGFNGSSQSRTGFSFYQIPTLFNAIYRFNLMRVLRPYASAGVGAVWYVETRGDNKKDKRGYSAVYNASAGVSVLLDFLDSSSHRDSYLSTGIQHTYLFVEYLYLNSFKSNVMFHRAGIYSGFVFEF